ncbi:F-box protein [Achlya hypogyna]|uniref:F-box protein n=1 Tax=Achlya hypogyna TaxID=1202772 RepID=A0A1V9YJA3_ACHHY|nr:F-box protein [Achlya hypogyna]
MALSTAQLHASSLQRRRATWPSIPSNDEATRASSTASSDDDDNDDEGDDDDEDKDLKQSSTYYEEHLPATTPLGEVLMTLATGHMLDDAPAPWRRVWAALPWYAHMVLATSGLLIWWFSFLAAFAMVSTRSAVLTAGLLLGGSAVMYLLVVVVLVRLPRTSAFGHSIYARLSLSRPPSRLRVLVEPCIWVALVMSSYALSRSYVASIAVGGLAGVGLVLVGDVIQVALHILGTGKGGEDEPRTLQYALMAVAAMYVVHSCHALALSVIADGTLVGWHYLLSILVGVSLIVASELLLLYGPTRHAGIVLQSRVLHARANWTAHPLRSLVELGFVLLVSMAAYNYFGRLLASLQVGTLACAVFILTGEFYFYPTPALATALPLDDHHWMKLLPLLVVVTFMLYHVGFILARHVRLLLPLLNVLALGCAVGLGRKTGLRRRLWRRLGTSFAAQHPWQASWEILAHTAFCAFVHPDAPLPLVVAANVLFDVGVVGSERAGTWLWDRVALLQYATSFRVNLAAGAESPARSHAPLWDVDPPPPSLSAYVVDGADAVSVPMSVFCNLLVLFGSLAAAVAALTRVLLSATAVVPVLAATAGLAVCSGLLIGSAADGQYYAWLRRRLYALLQDQAARFPLQIFVEVATWLGVCIGSYALSGWLSFAVALATLSALVVLVGGRFVARRLVNKRDDPFSTTCALVFFVVFVTYATALCLYYIYYHIHRIEVAFCLATLSGVVFVASSELCLLWEPSRAAGLILQTRVTHARTNWRLEPVRSFLELFVWVGVTYGSFELYQDVVLALQLGTFSGIVVTLAGELFRSQHASFFPADELAAAQRNRPKVLPLLLLFAYVGAGTFQWIFEHLRRLEVMVGLATIAGIVFLCVADVLVLWTPTRWAGLILQDRFLQAGANWQTHPVRSFVELGCFLGVIYGSHAIYGDLSVAVQCGTLSGMCVALIGDQLKSQRGPVAPHDKQQRILPLPIMSVLALVGAVAFNTIYTHLRSIEVAFVLATTSSVAFVVLGDMFVIWRPTRYVGLILQERILNARHNFATKRLRSYGEFGTMTAALYAAYRWRQDVLVAMQLGTFTGIVVCVANEAITSYVRAHKQRMLSLAAGHSDRQEDAHLLAMPYEVLFEIARFLSPEELLVARATCHKVNDLLRAESARFWLHAHLRRQWKRYGLDGGRVVVRRSLIYEAWKALSPNLWSPREPSSLLTAKIACNRALKWVYLNADWIRGQHLPPLPSDAPPTLTLTPADAGFQVFRHLPDKEVLGIRLVRGDGPDADVRVVSVPARLYAKLQADPFSFVVSETLYEVEACTTTHLVNAAFFAMVVICSGHAVAQLMH